MGVNGGGVLWCLLIAGLLLLAVASAAEPDTGKEEEEEIRWCKKDCDWKAGKDTGKAKECKVQCERRRRHDHDLLSEDGESFDSCVSKCRGHGGWWGKERWERCGQICRRRQEGEGGDDDFDDGRRNTDDDRCERMCQHYHDRREKKQCMRGCKYGESDLLGFDDDDGDKRGDRCQTRCKRFRPGSYDRWQCTRKCQSHQQEDEEEEEVTNHHGGSSCEQKCQQRYRHEYDKQQCVRDCKSGGGGGAGGRGREGDKRQHDREMVVEAILEDEEV